jgi:hypothetical protein
VSVRVTIEQSPGRSFHREILISRVTNLGVEGSRTHDIRDMVSSYDAEIIGGRPAAQPSAVTFEHRYGDDLFMLVAEAIAAFGGELPETRARKVKEALESEKPGASGFELGLPAYMWPQGGHIGRSFGGGRQIEEECPCPKEQCGLVDIGRASPACEHHGFMHNPMASKTIRQSHKPADCQPLEAGL